MCLKSKKKRKNSYFVCLVIFGVVLHVYGVDVIAYLISLLHRMRAWSRSSTSLTLSRRALKKQIHVSLSSVKYWARALLAR